MSKGMRPLSPDEIRSVVTHFHGVYAERNKSLFILGISVGGRISELLSLTIRDVWDNSKAVSDLYFNKEIVKGKKVARSVPLNVDAKVAIRQMVLWHEDMFGNANEANPLFPSRKGAGRKAMTRKAAHDVLKDAFRKAGLNGKLATHSMRKSYAQRLYDETRDLYLVKEMLGHASIETTLKYLGVNYRVAREATEAISVL